MASNKASPRELQDDDRASVLYSPFRSKTLNPSSWNSKMNFWQEHLKETALEKKMLIFDVDKLPSCFERKGIVPKCLPTVLQELERSGAIKPASKYARSRGWLSWGFSVLVKQPVSWLVGSSKSSLYVWPHVLKQVSEDALSLLNANRQPGIVGYLMSYPQLKDMLSALAPSDDDLSLVLTYLESEKKIQILETQKHGVVVKFCEFGMKAVTPLTDVDFHMFEILEVRKKLEKETESLTLRMDELTRQAQAFIRAGRKSVALNCLRRRRSASKGLERGFAMLHNLEELMDKIDNAQTCKMFIQASESYLSAMKNLSQGLSMDKVQAVMDNVQETLEDSEEISHMTSNLASTSTSSELDAEVEQELLDLLKELSPESENASPQDGSLELPDLTTLTLNDLDHLPDVPTHSPSSSSSCQVARKESRPESLPLPS